jgi:IclR family acetate operon transcriptional repressor
VELGAAQRDGQRYFVGSTLARLGQAWQPSPRLRDAALDPVRTLAALTRTAVAVTVLSGDRVRVVIATRGALGELPKITVGSDLARRTAAGQVLLAADENRDPPEEFSRAEWRRLRAGMRHSAIALDHQEVTPGVCCVATPVALPGGRGIASLSALSVGRALPRHVPDLVLRAAGEISRNLVVH